MTKKYTYALTFILSAHGMLEAQASSFFSSFKMPENYQKYLGYLAVAGAGAYGIYHWKNKPRNRDTNQNLLGTSQNFLVYRYLKDPSTELSTLFKKATDIVKFYESNKHLSYFNRFMQAAGRIVSRGNTSKSTDQKADYPLINQMIVCSNTKDAVFAYGKWSTLETTGWNEPVKPLKIEADIYINHQIHNSKDIQTLINLCKEKITKHVSFMVGRNNQRIAALYRGTYTENDEKNNPCNENCIVNFISWHIWQPNQNMLLSQDEIVLGDLLKLKGHTYPEEFTLQEIPNDDHETNQWALGIFQNKKINEKNYHIEVHKDWGRTLIIPISRDEATDEEIRLGKSYRSVSIEEALTNPAIAQNIKTFALYDVLQPASTFRKPLAFCLGVCLGLDKEFFKWVLTITPQEPSFQTFDNQKYEDLLDIKHIQNRYILWNFYKKLKNKYTSLEVPNKILRDPYSTHDNYLTLDKDTINIFNRLYVESNVK